MLVYILCKIVETYFKRYNLSFLNISLECLWKNFLKFTWFCLVSFHKFLKIEVMPSIISLEMLDYFVKVFGRHLKKSVSPIPIILMGPVFSYNSSSCSREPSIAGFLFALTSPVLLSLSLVSFGFFISLHLAQSRVLYRDLAWFLVGNQWLYHVPIATLCQTQKRGPSGQQLSLSVHWHLMMVTQVHYEGIPAAYFFYKDRNFLRNFMSRFCQLRVGVGSSVRIKAVMTRIREDSYFCKFIK